MPDVLSAEPTEITQNTTVSWTKYLSDYPTADYTLTYSFRSANFKFDKTATVDGSNFLVELTADETKVFPPGPLWWLSKASKGASLYAVDDGIIEIQSDLSSLASYDGRTFAEKMLDAIESILTSRATAGTIDLVSKTIGVENIDKRPDLLMQWRDKFLIESKKDRGEMQNILVRFV